MAKLDFSKAGATKSINKTIKKSNMKGNALATANIRLSDIDENPDNKLVFNMEDIDKLAKTIEKDGFYGAIEVYDKGDGRYEISAGHRRFNAVKQLGWETIPATITSMPNDMERRLKLVKSNINHRNMKPLDWAKAIAYTRETYYMKDAEEAGIEYIPPEKRTSGYHAKKIDVMQLLMDDFNISKAQIQKYLALLSYPEELQQLIRDEKISMTALIPVNGESYENKIEIAKELSNMYDNLQSAEDDSEDYLLNRKHVDIALSKLSYRKIKESRMKKERYTEPVAKKDVILKEEPVYEEEEEIEEYEEEESSDIVENPPVYQSSYAGDAKEPIKVEALPKPKLPVLDNLLYESCMKFRSFLESEYEIVDKKAAMAYVKELNEMFESLDL